MTCACGGCVTKGRERVVLTASEVHAADAIELARNQEDIATNRKPAYGADHSTQAKRLKIGLQGARCEAAFAKYLGERHEKGAFYGPDVGGYHVRGTEHLGGCLLLHPKDIEGVYVLVVGPLAGSLAPIDKQAMAFYVCGWIEARHGKKNRWVRDPHEGRPAFFVPQTALSSIRSLPRLKRAA